MGKAVLIVLDGVGVGEMPDARRYDDEGSNTLLHTAEAVGGLRLKNLEQLGLGNILAVPGVCPVADPQASYGRMAEVSEDKDSTTGHWELAGLINPRKFPTYPLGFPAELMRQFLLLTDCTGFLGNRTASGTEIMETLGPEHLRTGHPIVYTSADSVFQIAAHEDVIPIPRLYEICERTRRQVCVGAHEVSRVIARPFVGKPGQFTRTTHRKDFSVAPRGITLLDMLAAAGIPTVVVGKVDQLFNGRGISHSVHTKSNVEGIQETVHQMHKHAHGLIFTNLVDFDSLYGHRNDAPGFARALEEFDRALPDILEALSPEDLLFITADHGNDPVTPSTDHSREYVPLLCYWKGGDHGINLGTRPTFADVGKTIAEYFGLANKLSGISFLDILRRAGSGLNCQNAP